MNFDDTINNQKKTDNTVITNMNLDDIEYLYSKININKADIDDNKNNEENIEIINLQKILYYLKNNLNDQKIQELSNKCASISNICKGDGAGLLGGSLIDMFLSKYLKLNLDKYEECHDGECDMLICDTYLSQKKINGKSIIALDWSKNKINIKNNVKKKYFNHHILLINLKTQQWWKKKQNNTTNDDNYNDVITSGIYLINKYFCKKNIILSNNNKTNSLIDSINLYKMIKHSITMNLYLEIPSANKDIEFNILNAFSE